MSSKPFVILFNGVPGIGKSTLAKEFAKRLKYSAFIDVDKLRHFIIGGFIEPVGSGHKNFEKFEKQRLLAADNVYYLCRNFSNLGFNCFISDVVLIPSVLKRYNDNFKRLDFHHIILTAGINEIIKRDKKKEKYKIIGAEMISVMNKHFVSLKCDNCIKIDTSNKTVDEIIVLIAKNLRIKL